jgi:hypothetical protein
VRATFDRRWTARRIAKDCLDLDDELVRAVRRSRAFQA